MADPNIPLMSGAPNHITVTNILSKTLQDAEQNNAVIQLLRSESDLVKRFQDKNIVTPYDVAKALTGEGGAYAGGFEGVMQREVEEVVKKYGVSPLRAGAILSQSSESRDYFNPIDWGSFLFGSGRKQNSDDTEQYGNIYRNPELEAKAIRLMTDNDQVLGLMPLKLKELQDLQKEEQNMINTGMNPANTNIYTLIQEKQAEIASLHAYARSIAKELRPTASSEEDEAASSEEDEAAVKLANDTYSIARDNPRKLETFVDRAKGLIGMPKPAILISDIIRKALK